MPEAIEPQLTKNALTVLERRYLKKDDQGQVVETPAEMFRRVAQNIASAELIYDPKAKARVAEKEEEFYQAMASLEFLPNSPTLMNAGRELQQLSACFVLPIEDSMVSIFETIKNTALIHQSGGGTGFSFSRLRPKGDRVRSTGGVASGPLSFMKVFNAATDAVKQGGTRRGANMAILSVDHPDILEFITAKEESDAFNNFNLSVAISEAFMEAVDRGADYDLINPRTGQTVGKLSARNVFNLIVETAWSSGEPGIVFLDRINKDNPTPKIGAIESTNPCGEQPLLPYESCNLGSINLAKMVCEKDGTPSIDYAKLERTINTAVRFLDNVIDVNRYPLPIIAEMTKANRKIGLGVMGFADMLIALGIPYDSEADLEIARNLMCFIRDKARFVSVELAKERGVLPNFQGSIYDVTDGLSLRNATITTIAPTGTLSIIANCSSGIEPLFALSYVRNILDNDHLLEVNPAFEKIAREEGFYSVSLMEAIADKGSIQDMAEIPSHVRRIFVTAHDVSPEWHVRMQAAFQKYTDNAVSKTVNFPHDATVEDVRRAYLLAYQEGCKGITIYRDRSRDKQVLTVKKKEATAVTRIVPRPRPTVTTGSTEKVSTGCGNLYVTVNSDDQGICEVFTQMGKAGGCAAAQAEAVARLISLALRSGVDPDSIVRQLKGIRCPSIAWREGSVILSCPDAVSKVLEKYSKNGDCDKQDTSLANTTVTVRNIAGECPECSSLIEYVDGCFVCRSCGYSKCG